MKANSQKQRCLALRCKKHSEKVSPNTYHVVSRLTFSHQLLWHITNLKFKIMGFAIILVYFVLIQKINKASRKSLILILVFY